MEPKPAASQVEVVRDGAVVRVDIRLLPREEQLGLLSTTRSSTRIARIDRSGKLSYLTGSVTGGRGSYAVFMDHASYYVERVTDRDGAMLGSYKTGIGLRLVAAIETRRAGLDLGSIFKLGIAASRSELNGSMEVMAFGVGGPQINSLLPGIMSTIDEGSIQRSLEALAAVKAKFWDRDTVIAPQHFAVQSIDESLRSSIQTPDITSLAPRN
ncbi:MAG TPA: hypothetical protein PK170_01815 [Anaerolineae bacterium]|nr:hypothetical protein [Anaerolineae bacterium]